MEAPLVNLMPFPPAGFCAMLKVCSCRPQYVLLGGRKTLAPILSFTISPIWHLSHHPAGVAESLASITYPSSYPFLSPYPFNPDSREGDEVGGRIQLPVPCRLVSLCSLLGYPPSLGSACPRALAKSSLSPPQLCSSPFCSPLDTATLFPLPLPPTLCVNQFLILKFARLGCSVGAASLAELAFPHRAKRIL